MTDAHDPAAPQAAVPPQARGRKAAWWQRALAWTVTAACFAYLWFRVDAAAGPDRGTLAYLADVFASVSWWHWLALMVPYSLFFFLIDTAILWRVINWFNAPVAYRHLLPVRASSYILSILNEQVGKGAMAVYLNRREGVPGWQILSSMLFIMFCEFFYLLSWALVGYALSHEMLPPLFDLIPWIAAGAALFFAAFVFFFRSARFAGSALRERDLLLSFREAPVWRYLVVMLMRSPALLAAVLVYREAAALFGVEIPLLDMLGVLPVIFFGTMVPGPFRAVAVTMWPVLFAEQAGEMAAFGFVQHNFFVLFNAAIGLVFLRRANQELFGSPAGGPAQAPSSERDAQRAGS